MTEAKPTVPGSRDFIAEALRADIEKADAERAAARAMLAALNKARAEESCSPVIAYILDKAIAQAEAAGLKAGEG